MSLNKSATRRLSLLCGSSIVAATLSAAAIILAPTSALAANECAPIGVAPSANGPVADTYACTGATTYQASGITYSSQGNLTVNSTGAMDVGAVGVNLTGNGTDNVVFSATGPLTGSSGAVVDIATASGNINATTNGITGATGATGAIRMESAGAGNIVFTRTGANATGSVNSDTATGDTAVTAISHGGNITMTIPTASSSATAPRGRLYGIVAETSGTGSVTITATGNGGVLTDRLDGIAAIDVTAGSGGITLNLGRVNSGYGDGANQPHGTGDGVLATTTGSINITVSGNANFGLAAGNDGIVAVAGGALNITNNSAIFTAFTTGGDAIRGTAGAGATITNNGLIGIASNGGLGSGPSASGGVVDLSGVTGGGAIFRNLGAGRWITNGDNAFSSQNDLLEMTGTGQSWFGAETTVAFGAGTDTFNMNARLIAEGAVLTDLEAFNSSGEILLGWNNGGAITDTDYLPDDYLSMPGATFTGSGASHIVLDVALGGVAQVGCETLTGAADCIDIRGGATAGSTLLTINDATPGGMIPGYVPQGITVIDVAGGTSSASHFTLDPASTNGYVNPLYGSAFDRPGAFVYVFRYDAENQRHILVGQPRDGSLFNYAILSGAAQSIWHLTSETVTNRQTDLRGGAEGGTVWLRTAGEVTRRDQSATFEGFDGTVTFDNGYKLYAGTILGGMDLISGGGEAFDYVLGAQIGYVSSSFDMDESEASGRFTGGTGGAYASLWSDWFFFDGALNINGLTLDYEHPTLGSKTTTYVNSVGVSAEAGVRARITENGFVEPLGALSWVRTRFEEISLSAGEVEPADAESLRAGLGLRLGATLPGESVSASYFVTGRGWYEVEGETSGLVHNPGVDLPFGDEFDGAFGEAELGVNVFNTANTLSAFATTGVKWKEGYSAVNLALGVRMAW